MHTARNCRDELRAGIGNPPLPANEHLIHQLPAADAIIAPVNGPQVAFPEYLVDLVSNAVAGADLAFVCGVLIDDHDIPLLPVSASKIEPPLPKKSR